MFELIRTLIVASAIAHGVSADLMVSTAWCESRFDRYAYNSAGPYIGLYQLGPGMQSRFYGHGYNDLHDPAQQANFTAEIIAAGGHSNWPTWGRICR